MTTRHLTHDTNPRRTGRLAIASAAAALLAGVGVTAVMLDQRGAATPSTPHLEPVTTGLPASADAAEHWLTPRSGPDGPACRPDAAQRWQIPNIAAADLPQTADAAEAWLTPEINIADLPQNADAAEHWLCAP